MDIRKRIEITKDQFGSRSSSYILMHIIDDFKIDASKIDNTMMDLTVLSAQREGVDELNEHLDDEKEKEIVRDEVSLMDQLIQDFKIEIDDDKKQYDRVPKWVQDLGKMHVAVAEATAALNNKK